MSLLSLRHQSRHQHLLRNRMFHTATANQPLRVITGMAAMVRIQTKVKVKTRTKGKDNTTTLAQLVRMLDGVMLDKEE